MTISNSKKQLAEIIHENGGWYEGAGWAAQDKDGEVYPYATKPSIDKGSEVWGHKGCIGYGEFPAKTLPNWHQTILSRDEYIHLYPALGELCGNVTEENRHEQVWTNPPSIEQLAADYRNRKDYADRKQQEADAAKADAEAKLAELVAAGKALGLVLGVAGVAPEPDACADGWVEYDGGGCPVDANEVVEVFLRKGRPSLDGPKAAHEWDWSIEDVEGDIVKWRRAKGGTNA